MKMNLCSRCCFPADSKQDPDTSYFMINYNIYCSLNCFFEVDREKMKQEESKVLKKKPKKKSKKK